MAKKQETFLEAEARLKRKRKALGNIEEKIKKDPDKYVEKIKSSIKNFDPEKDKPEGYDARKKKEAKIEARNKEKQRKKDLRDRYKRRTGSGGGGAGGLSFKDYLEGGLPGKRRMRRGGKVSMKHGGLVHGNASKRADGIAKRGKTKGRKV